MVAAPQLPQTEAPLSLTRAVSRLADDAFDVAVVGGGISGVAIAYEAAARGLKVALVERGDFAAGTTTASTKLIHGGVRYLESYEFGLVREALRERRILLNMAPHLVNTVPFLIPHYVHDKVGLLKLHAGMFVYDVLSYDKNWKARSDKHVPWRKSLSKSGMLALEPGLRDDGLTGGAMYYDGQVPSPARLTIEFAKSAEARGAAIANYCEVVGVQLEGGKVTALEVRDLREKRDVKLRAKVVVNAAGLWATRIMGLLKHEPSRKLAPSKGIHLITRPLLRDHAAVFTTRAGRKLMVIPWQGKSLIGTTDEFYQGNLERIRCTRDEVARMVAEVNEVLPSSKLQVEEVDRAYAGCRPLIAKEGVSSLDLSRHWEIVDHAHEGAGGVYSVVGGKLTTSRSVAMHVINRVEHHLGQRAPSPTRTLPIGGGDIGPLVDEVSSLEKSHGLPHDVANGLVHAYGSSAPRVLAEQASKPGALDKLRPDMPFVRAQVRHAVQREMAFRVSDVALRRMDLGNLGDHGAEGGKIVAAELQKLLGWSDAERESQLAEYLDELAIDEK
ncbi:MAG: glycerol-3-phosphate dehydrogenase/oxidase [Deltaproteobacteria bacterium]|nr:glycerol-3-phosphate dehydrogenase/oxidase [Deltaproteobacteria bacterium]